MSYEAAASARYRSVTLPFDWGPLWSTAWFRLTGSAGGIGADEEPALELLADFESLLWLDGQPYKGFNDRLHFYSILPKKALKAQENRLLVEGACNRAQGANVEPKEPLPAKLTAARLVARHREMWALLNDADLLYQLMIELPVDSPRRKRLLYGLNAMVNRLDPADPRATASAAREPLAELLACRANASATVVSTVGHSHIDVAWRWPYRETIRKCSRTFSTVLRLMEQYDDFCFVQSQPQLYEYVKEHYPAIYKQIARRVKEGRWEADGGVWVEMDCNLASGEAMVRQILYAHKFFGKEFGRRSQYLWLPDVFGYSAALPQILMQCGLTSFITNKMAWNQFNQFPYYTFWWVGIDGTRIFSHFLPSKTYGGFNTPQQLVAGDNRFAESDRLTRWINPFGVSDGGGGPSAEMLERAERSADLEGMPRVEYDTVGGALEKMKRESRDLPVWSGELYLEFHRGTYTTQARTKLGNRKSELLLRDVECLMALSPKGASKADLNTLERLWKLLLLNQFHDVLPGTSINWVHRDAEAHYAEIAREGETLRQAYLRRWAGTMDTSGIEAPVVAVNTCSWERTELAMLPRDGDSMPRSARIAGEAMPLQAALDSEGRPVWLARVTAPSIGAVVVERTNAEPEMPKGFQPVTAKGRTLENRYLKVVVDAKGRIERIYDKEARREALHDGRPANRLALYEDRPNQWDAWDIDAFYLEKAPREAQATSIRIVEEGPLRAALEVSYALGKSSTAVQRIRLAADSRCLDFDTEVQWHERHTLLRALFPVRVLSDHATCDIQFGHLRRPTHTNTSWDMARFEVCAHKWIDLSEAGYGVALMNDCKYGHSAHGDTLGISLLRSPTRPDPEADQGYHRFTYSLYPHPGGFREAEVNRRAYELNVPLLLMETDPSKGPRGRQWRGLCVDSAGVVIETVKPVDSGASGRIVVRAYEAHGGRGPVRLTSGLPLGKAVAVSPLEEPTEEYRVEREGDNALFEVTPFALRTLSLDITAAPRP